MNKCSLNINSVFLNTRSTNKFFWLYSNSFNINNNEWYFMNDNIAFNLEINSKSNNEIIIGNWIFNFITMIQKNIYNGSQRYFLRTSLDEINILKKQYLDFKDKYKFLYCCKINNKYYSYQPYIQQSLLKNIQNITNITNIKNINNIININNINNNFIINNNIYEIDPESLTQTNINTNTIRKIYLIDSNNINLIDSFNFKN